MNAAERFWRRILSLCAAAILLVAAMAADAADGAETAAGRTLAECSSELQSSSPVVRRRAVLSLGAFAKSAVPTLTQALAHDDPVVRYWAASELGDLGDEAKSALESLRKVHGEKSIGVRIAAAYALCRIGQVEEALPTLLEGLKHDARGVWNSSADFLARIGPPARAAIPTLEEESKRGADHIADICNEALLRIRGVDQPVPSKTVNATQGDAAGGKANKKASKESVFSKAFLDEDVARFSKPSSSDKARFGKPGHEKKQPNVLWISAEDISPSLGCYGDSYAITPRLDQLASEGMRFNRCFTHAGVCAISRSGLITGMYPVSIGSQHMRSQIVLPPNVKAFPEYLRAAGYWTTNRSKTDYNFPPPKAAWDENNANARDWRGRAAGQPFFSVINLVTTHESQIRGKFGETLHDPAKAQLPPYIPDTPVTRRDWARYADLLTTLDQQVAAILDQLEADGLANDTIVFFWGDHGQGLPRGKRWLYDSGTRVPLIIRWPGKLKAGSVSDDLICFLDFAPTMLRLAGVETPSHLHGQPLTALEVETTAISTQPTAIRREFIFGHRDRMDETYDLIRSARDTRFKYLRNYAPHRSYAQNITYMNQMPTMREMRRLNAEGQLSDAAALFFRETKPVEELFDTQADPHEIVNLADRPEHAETLKRMRAALEHWQEEVSDSGLIPEPLLDTPAKVSAR